MNRIILIGNGFDLAHRLETSYKHFIDDYWGNVANSLKKRGGYNDDHVEIIPNLSKYQLYSCLSGAIGYFSEMKNTTYKGVKDFLQSHKWVFKVKNNFLDKISDECSFKNWVDIEKEYYSELKSCLNKTTNHSIESLNKDFDEVKQLLLTYLCNIEITTDLCKNDIFNKMVSEFNYKEFTQTFKNHFVNEKMKYVNSIVNSDRIYEEENEKALKSKFSTGIYDPINFEDIEKLITNGNASYFFPDLLSNNYLILNFNYTNTYRLYDDRISEYQRNSKDYCTKEVKVINIHGELNNMNNPMIFGFGDEIDEDYSKIENLDDNRYLENIKSTKYHETDNYKKLLEYIDGDYFQIFIFGHSCGLSDRTLLSTLFNHDNCISIKPFYYIKEDGSDNYSDLVRNISRHFKDKASLRDKVVNKTYCEPLTGSK